MIRHVGLLLFSLMAVGCSRVPKGPDKPVLDPAASGQRAIAEYDANGDGRLTKDELTKCRALEMALPRVDKNSDVALSAEEIADRIRYYQTAATTIISGSTQVTLDGEPLAGATVTFEPESFLGGAFQSCSGETDDSGMAFITGHDAKFAGIYLGLYRVRISKQDGGKEMVPARFNTESVLGYEATDDIPEVKNVIQFDLES